MKIRLNRVCFALATALILALCTGPATAGGGSDLTLNMVALNVPDLEAAEKYYTEVLGFKRQGTYPPDGKNVIEIFLSAPGQGGAGLALAKLNNDPLPEGKGRYGRLILNTSDAKAVAKRAEKAGAKIREITIPGDNPPVIIFFHDPNGYEIELYQAPK